MSTMEAFPQSSESRSKEPSQATPTNTRPYEAPDIIDLGAWQVVTGSGIFCGPSGCDVEF